MSPRGPPDHVAVVETGDEVITRMDMDAIMENLELAKELPDDAVVERRRAKYAVECQSCGAVFRRKVRSSVVQEPERYHCSCGGDLRRTN